LTSSGASRAISSKSFSVNGTPRRPASASRWTTALVEPPSAACIRMAFSKAARVMMSDGLMSSFTSWTMRFPLRWASTLRRESTAGRAAFIGSEMPSASVRLAMVEAVPMVLQTPAERLMPLSALMKSSRLISPARTASEKRQTSVPEPMSRPWNLPFSMEPEETKIAGTSTLAAPIKRPGVVLSQPPISTTPSMGLARIDSSTSMASKFRNSMAVGRIWVSGSDMAGNSMGTPPASQTPRFT
jgi:hypothetical protein